MALDLLDINNDVYKYEAGPDVIKEVRSYIICIIYDGTLIFYVILKRRILFSLLIPIEKKTFYFLLTFL